MSLLDVEELREHIETDLIDDVLARIIEAAEADIIRVAGALPDDDTLESETARRVMVLVDIAKLAVEYEPISAKSVGGVTMQRVNYIEERSRILNTLVSSLFA